MRRFWGHTAMLLLGVSLTVGFYEGRQLVKNTAKAITAATTLQSPSKRERKREANRDPLSDELAALSADAGVDKASDPPERRRRKRAATSLDRELDGLSRSEKLNLLRDRQRQRLQLRPAGGLMAPGSIGPGSMPGAELGGFRTPGTLAGRPFDRVPGEAAPELPFDELPDEAVDTGLLDP